MNNDEKSLFRFYKNVHQIVGYQMLNKYREISHNMQAYRKNRKEINKVIIRLMAVKGDIDVEIQRKMKIYAFKKDKQILLDNLQNKIHIFRGYNMIIMQKMFFQLTTFSRISTSFRHDLVYQYIDKKLKYTKYKAFSLLFLNQYEKSKKKKVVQKHICYKNYNLKFIVMTLLKNKMLQKKKQKMKVQLFRNNVENRVMKFCWFGLNLAKIDNLKKKNSYLISYKMQQIMLKFKVFKELKQLKQKNHIEQLWQLNNFKGSIHYQDLLRYDFRSIYSNLKRERTIRVQLNRFIHKLYSKFGIKNTLEQEQVNRLFYKDIFKCLGRQIMHICQVIHQIRNTKHDQIKTKYFGGLVLLYRKEQLNKKSRKYYLWKQKRKVIEILRTHRLLIVRKFIISRKFKSQYQLQFFFQLLKCNLKYQKTAQLDRIIFYYLKKSFKSLKINRYQSKETKQQYQWVQQFYRFNLASKAMKSIKSIFWKYKQLEKKLISKCKKKLFIRLRIKYMNRQKLKNVFNVLVFDKQDYVEELFKQPVRIKKNIFNAWKLVAMYGKQKKEERVKCLMAINHYSVHLVFQYFRLLKKRYQKFKGLSKIAKAIKNFYNEDCFGELFNQQLIIRNKIEHYKESIEYRSKRNIFNYLKLNMRRNKQIKFKYYQKYFAILKEQCIVKRFDKPIMHYSSNIEKKAILGLFIHQRRSRKKKMKEQKAFEFRRRKVNKDMQLVFIILVKNIINMREKLEKSVKANEHYNRCLMKRMIFQLEKYMIHSQSKKILSNNEKFIEDQSCNSKYHHQTKNQAQLQAQEYNKSLLQEMFNRWLQYYQNKKLGIIQSEQQIKSDINQSDYQSKLEISQQDQQSKLEINQQEQQIKSDVKSVVHEQFSFDANQTFKMNEMHNLDSQETNNPRIIVQGNILLQKYFNKLFQYFQLSKYGLKESESMMISSLGEDSKMSMSYLKQVDYSQQMDYWKQMDEAEVSKELEDLDIFRDQLNIV